MGCARRSAALVAAGAFAVTSIVLLLLLLLLLVLDLALGGLGPRDEKGKVIGKKGARFSRGGVRRPCLPCVRVWVRVFVVSTDRVLLADSVNIRQAYECSRRKNKRLAGAPTSTRCCTYVRNVKIRACHLVQWLCSRAPRPSTRGKREVSGEKPPRRPAVEYLLVRCIPERQKGNRNTRASTHTHTMSGR